MFILYYCDTKIMPQSWLVPVSGKTESVHWPHESVCSEMGGMITFVGAIDDLHVFALALAASEELPVNTRCTDCNVFLQLPVRGPVLFIATDDAGEPMDVDVEAIESHLLTTI